MKIGRKETKRNLKEILVKSVSSIFLRVIGLVFGLYVSLFIGNNFGSEDLGIFALSSKTLEFIVIISMFGFGEILMKEIAIKDSKYDVDGINDYIQSGIGLVLLFSLSLVSFIFFFSKEIASIVFNNPLLGEYLKIFSIIAFFKVLISFISQVLKGLRFTWQANALRDTVSITILGILITIFYLLKYNISLILICELYLFTHIFTLILAAIFVKNKVSWRISKRNLDLKFKIFLIRQSYPLLIVSSFVLINSFIDVFMLTSFSTLKEVGLYSVASRLSFLLNLALIMSGTIIAPRIAQLYYDKNYNELKKTILYCSNAFVLVGLIFILSYWFFGNYILSFWGDEFVHSYVLLIILSAGYFINLIFGLSTFMLSMTGFQKLLGRISLFFGVLNILLNYFLIKKYGALGAAIATCTTLTLESFAKVYYAKIQTKILILPFFKNSN